MKEPPYVNLFVLIFCGDRTPKSLFVSTKHATGSHVSHYSPNTWTLVVYVMHISDVVMIEEYPCK